MTVIVALSFIASACDLYGWENEWLMAFSIKRNFKEIISTKIGSNEIAVLNGIRVLITLMMVLSHKLMQYFYYSISNQNKAEEAFQAYLSIPFRAVFFSTESFLMMSGFLTAYTIVGKLNRKQDVNVFKEILMRYLRFMPPMLCMIFFYAYILPLLGSGPKWPILMTYQSELCRKFYWRNLLMIHNIFGFENICMYNLHHIGTDFVLFIGAVIIIVALYKNYNALISTLTAIGILSAIATFAITYKEDLITYIYYGVT